MDAWLLLQEGAESAGRSLPELVTPWLALGIAALTLLGLVAAALVALWKRVARPAVRAAVLDAVGDLRRPIEETREHVRRELQPNGGASLKDQMGRLDERSLDTQVQLGRTELRVVQLHERTDQEREARLSLEREVKGRLEVLEAALDALRGRPGAAEG